MALSFTGTQPIYCRRRSFADGTTILQGPWLANASATTGTITLSGIDVPAINAAGTAPVAANDGWFYLDVATSSVGPWTNGTSQVTAGRLSVIAGQSLAVRNIGAQDGQSGTVTNASLGITISPYTSILCTYNEARAYLPVVATMPWAPPADGGNYDSTFLSEFTRRQVQIFGCPAGVIGHARGAQFLSAFVGPAGAEATGWLAPVIARAGGAFESAIWYQGHSDATIGCPAGGYAQALSQLFTYFGTLNSLGSFTKYVGTIPNISSTSWGTPWHRNRIRAGAEQYCAATAGAVHVPAGDISLYTDGIHNIQVGSVTLAQHFARATKVEKSLRGDAGPAFVSATRVGTTITATFTDVGQGNLILTGTPGNRIFVFPTGLSDKGTTTGNHFPVSTVTVTNKTTLSIVLANDPGDAHVLDIWFYWGNETSSASAVADNIRDDVTDGDGITVGRQIVPNNTRVVIAAPGSGATNAPPGGFVANVSQFAMTETATTYGAQEQTGFNGTLNGGSAATAASKFPSYNPYTVEFWFTFPTANPVAQQYIVGGMGNFIAVSTNGKIVFNGATAVLTGGHRYHVACQASPAGHSIYLTDVTAAGSGTRVYTDAVASSGLPTGATLGLRNLNGSGILTATGATLDEVAIFDYLRYTGTTYTAPTAPFTGFEAGIVALFHLDASCAETVDN
jgi:hypothetical protein